MSNSSIRRVVTTVHGTYAKHATWVEPDSKLGVALTQRFGAGVKMIPFRWSGRNNPSARAKAKDKLRAHLSALLGDYPEASHYIIAHSHGGNVALYALRDDETLRDKIAGVACLATPFLVSRHRVLGSRDVTTQIVGAVVLLGVVSAILTMLWLDAFHPACPKEPMIFVLTLFLFGIVGSLNNWQTYGERLHRELQLATLSRERLLIIRAPGDEASAALLFFQFVSELSVRVYVLLYQLQERFLRLLNRWSGHRLWLLAALVGGFVLFGFIFGAAALKIPMGLIIIMTALLTWLCVVVPLMECGGIEAAAVPVQFLISAVLFAVIIVLSITLLPFGWQVALSNILLDITAETTPPGEWVVNQIEPTPSHVQDAQ